MAVNINSVYETVLTILNKEQRGYLDSEEFNKVAAQVQREIFEGYFLKQLAAPGSDTDYSSPEKNIDEKIAVFEIQTDIPERNEDSFFEYPTDLYRLGVVLTDADIIVDETSHMDAAYVNLSKFTAPTEKQPIYTKEAGGIQVYPKDDTNAVTDVKMVYLKTPTDPIWAFDQTEFDDTGDIVYSNDNSIDFELHPSEQHELVIKILAYAGVVVRDPAVTGFAQQVEQKITGTEA